MVNNVAPLSFFLGGSRPHALPTSFVKKHIVTPCDSMRVELKFDYGNLFLDQHIDRAIRSGMEPVVNSTVKMSRNG